MILWITIQANGYADELVNVNIYQTKTDLLDAVSKFLLERIIDAQHERSMSDDRTNTIINMLRKKEIEGALHVWSQRNEDRLKGFPTNREELIIQRKLVEPSVHHEKAI